MSSGHSLASKLAAAASVLTVAGALWLALRILGKTGVPAAPGVSASTTETAVATAVSVASTLPPFTVQHNPGVADLLANPPASGASVEVGAYFAGALGTSMLGGPPPPDDQVWCPQPWLSYLTDRPFLPTLQYLNSTTSNSLPEAAAWLIAASPEQTRPGSRVAFPALPYHARLRGHLGERAFAGCQSAGRIFVVEEVTQVYEQDPPQPVSYGMDIPADYAAWPRYADPEQGFSLPYPTDWQVQRLDDVTLMLAGSLWPGHPVIVRVHPGETHYDQYDVSNLPPLLQSQGFGVFEQGWSAFAQAGLESQHLAGYTVERQANEAAERPVAVLFSGSGRTYEIALAFPTGFAASQELLTAYTGIVEGFRLDTDPGPTPTAPIKQTLGSRPFLAREQALAAAERVAESELELISAQLVAEAEARRLAQACNTFMGHPDGVWLLTVRGRFEGQVRTMQLFLDAERGEQLCGEELALPLIPPEPANATATAVLPPEIYPSPVATLQAIGLEDQGCPNPAGVEMDIALTAEEALQVMRGYFSADPDVAQRVRDPVLWRAAELAPTAVPEEQLQLAWFQAPRPASESPYAGSLRVHCGDRLLAASWTVVYCRGRCDAPGLPASLMEDYFLLRRNGQWLVWYVWP